MSQGFNWIDIVLIAVLVLSGSMGIFRGGIREMASLLSWVVGYLVAVTFSHALAKFLTGSAFFARLTSSASQSIGTDTSTQASMLAIGISFMLLFCVTVFIGSIVGRLVNGMFESGGVSFLNRFIGVVMGVGRGYLASIIVIFIAQFTPVTTADAWIGSKMIKLYDPSVTYLSNLVNPGIENLKKNASSLGVPLTNDVPDVSSYAPASS